MVALALKKGLKFSIEKPVSLDFVYFSIISCPRLQSHKTGLKQTVAIFSDTKLDGSFPTRHILIADYASPYSLDQNQKSRKVAFLVKRFSKHFSTISKQQWKLNLELSYKNQSLYVFFFFVFETHFKDCSFYSPILLILWFRYLQTCIEENCLYLPKCPKNSKKNPFSSNLQASKFQKFSLQCLSWGHPRSHRTKQKVNFRDRKTVNKSAWIKACQSMCRGTFHQD